jgi:hypothetical protein
MTAMRKESDWIIRHCLGREPCRVWWRGADTWVAVEILGTHPETGQHILRELDNPLSGIWLADASEILHL